MDEHFGRCEESSPGRLPSRSGLPACERAAWLSRLADALDNRVDFADYDKDHDGVFEKRMFDDDGDGYLDRTVLQ